MRSTLNETQQTAIQLNTMLCLHLLLLAVILQAFLATLTQGETIHERHEYAYSLIQEIFENYPEYVNKLLEYHSEVKKFNMKNETYRGFIRQMRRNNKYELLIADAYAYNFKNKVYESGRHPNTVLYQCDKAIRYSSGNPMYCEYDEGSHDSRIIVVSGHGGELKPDSIPDREAGCWVNGSCLYAHNCEDATNGIWKNYQSCSVVDNADVTTSKITRWFADELFKLTAKRPHLIINNLHRHKIDMNREIPLATFDVPEANQAWRDYHELIETAKANLKGQRGLLLDIHGNDLNEQWNMFGYGIDKETLNSDNFQPSDSNIRSLGEYVDVPFDRLIRGRNSLGHFMQQEGIKSVPSMDFKRPGSRTYFPGAYTVDTHGSRKKGKVDSIMVEIYTKYRDEEKGKEFARDLAKSVNRFFKLNYENRGNYQSYFADIKGDEMQDNYSKSKENVKESQEEPSTKNQENEKQSEQNFKTETEEKSDNTQTESGRESSDYNNSDNNINTGSTSKEGSQEETVSASNNNEYTSKPTSDDVTMTNTEGAQSNPTTAADHLYSSSNHQQDNVQPSHHQYGTAFANAPSQIADKEGADGEAGQTENSVNYKMKNVGQNNSANVYYYAGNFPRPLYNPIYRKSSRKSNTTDESHK